MNGFENLTKFRLCSMALLLIAFMAGCGGGGGGSSTSGAGGIPGAPAGAIIPGATCTAASGATIPTVTSSDPTNGNQVATTSTSGVAANGKLITATFSLAMGAATINTTTFTVTPVGGAALVPASVSLDVATGRIATFTTSAALSPATSYTAIITQGAKSAAGTALSCTFAWNFKTTATATTGASAVNLGLAATFGLASRAGLTSTGVTVINGDVALFPTAACTDSTGNAGASQSCLVKVYASPTGMTVHGSIFFAGDPFDGGLTAMNVSNDLSAGWTQGQNKVDTFAVGALVGQLGGPGPAGKILLPGVYHEAALGLAAGTVATFDAQNDANAVFFVKVDSSFVDSGTLLLPTQIKLANGAQAKNIWFVTGLDATIGSGTIWNGNILAGRTVTVLDGSTVLGRVLAGATGAGSLTLTGAASPSVTTVTVP